MIVAFNIKGYKRLDERLDYEEYEAIRWSDHSEALRALIDGQSEGSLELFV